MNIPRPHWPSRIKPVYLFVLFLFTGVVFVLMPAAVIAPAAVFLFLHYRTKCAGCVLAALSWLLYGIWEYGMYTRTLCSGECNIRVDLFIAWTILAITSSKVINGYILNRNA